MIIAAFDLATATGVCDGPVGEKPRLFSWYLSDAGTGRPQRLLLLAKFLRAYFSKQPCDAVVYERPMPLGMMGEKGRNRIMLSEDNIAFARGSIGVLEMTCCEFNKPVEGVAVQDARQSVLGWRINAEKKTGIDTKQRVVDEVTGIHGIEAMSDNEADAWVAWRYACHLQNPRLAVAVTPLFRGRAS